MRICEISTVHAQRSLFVGCCMIFLTACGGSDSDTATTDTAQIPDGTPAVATPLSSDQPSGVPLVRRQPGATRGSYAHQVNLERDGDFSVADTIGDGLFIYEFADTTYTFVPSDTISRFTRFGELGGSTLRNDNGQLVNSGNSNGDVHLLALAFGDQTYDWYAAFLTSALDLPMGSDLVYTGGSLYTLYAANGLSQTGESSLRVDLDQNNSLLQIELDDQRGLVLRGSNIVLDSNEYTFRSVLRDDANTTVGIVDGAVVERDDRSLIVAVYAYRNANGDRAAGLMSAALQQ